MTYLSSNQLKQYKDEGFVAPINIFSKEKAKEIRNQIELIEKELPGELDKSGRYNAHLISPLLDKVTHNSKILDAVESLIGKNIEYVKKELEKVGSFLLENTAEGFKEFKNYMDKNYKGILDKTNNNQGNSNMKIPRITIPIGQYNTRLQKK